MVRLDHNRALSQLAATTGSKTTDISKMIIWGNHSATQYPAISHPPVGSTAAVILVDQAWVEQDFIQVVQHRGAAIFQARDRQSLVSGKSVSVRVDIVGPCFIL